MVLAGRSQAPDGGTEEQRSSSGQSLASHVHINGALQQAGRPMDRKPTVTL